CPRGVAERVIGVGALAEPLQHLAGELHARDHADVLAELAEVSNALAAARRQLLLLARHGDARHREQEARVDALVARLDAFAAEHAAARPFARRLDAGAAAHDVEHAGDDVFRRRRDARRIGDRAGFDAFAAARARCAHLVGTCVEGGFVGHAHRGPHIGAILAPRCRHGHAVATWQPDGGRYAGTGLTVPVYRGLISCRTGDTRDRR